MKDQYNVGIFLSTGQFNILDTNDNENKSDVEWVEQNDIIYKVPGHPL